jgi:hypothetical protein
MPLKLPAPDLGTEEQPGPKSAVVVAPEPAAEAGEDAIGAEEEAAGEDVEPEAAVEELLELHAAAPRTQVRARPDTAINLRFTTVSLRDLSLSGEVRLGAASWMRDRLM